MKIRLLLLCFLLVSALCLVGVSTAGAQINSGNYTQLDQPQIAGLLPDSPLYGFKLLWERVVDAFTIGENQIERNLILAVRRLAEAEAMEKKNLTDKAEKALSRAEDRFQKALDKAQQIDNIDTQAEIIDKIESTVGKHMQTLNQVMEKANTNAQKGLQNAINNSSKVLQKIQAVKMKVMEKRQNRGNNNDYTNIND